MRDNISQEEMLDVLRELAQPVDLDDLVANGVLEKSGNWYTVLKANDLPPHVFKHACAMEHTATGEVKLRFREDWKRANALYKKISGESL